MDLETLRTKYKTQILEIAARNHVENVRIFGSVARGEARENSDVDFLVHAMPDSDMFTIGGFYSDLEDLLPCKIDIVFDTGINWYMKDAVLNEAVKI